jgi:acetyltransferase-like isoleucine patch superfamily enzyme
VTGVSVGVSTVILGDVPVRNHALVGANSVVRSDVTEYSIVSGIPAEHVSYRTTPGVVA